MPFLHTKRRGLVIERSGAGVVGRKIDEEDITDNYWRLYHQKYVLMEKRLKLYLKTIYISDRKPFLYLISVNKIQISKVQMCKTGQL